MCLGCVHSAKPAHHTCTPLSVSPSGWGQVPPHLSLSWQNLLCILISAPQLLSAHSAGYFVLNIYKIHLSHFLFVAGIGSNTINNTGILQSIYVFKPNLKIPWRLLKVLIHQCNKGKRLLLLKNCFTYRESHWQEAEQTDKEALVALKFRNRTRQKNKE